LLLAKAFLDRGAANAGGFSLHAGIDIAPGQRQKLERLCRYVSRPPVSTERMALTSSGHVCYALKTPYRDGTTHIVLEPLVQPASASQLDRLPLPGGLRAGMGATQSSTARASAACRRQTYCGVGSRCA